MSEEPLYTPHQSAGKTDGWHSAHTHTHVRSVLGTARVASTVLSTHLHTSGVCSARIRRVLNTHQECAQHPERRCSVHTCAAEAVFNTHNRLT